LYEGTLCETETICDSVNILCLHGGKNTGVKIAKNCLCDCTLTKYWGNTCQNERPCYNTDNNNTVDF